jgi:hypothetical protein
MHLHWTNDYLWYLILLIPLIIAGYVMLRAIDKERVREKELAAAYSNYAEWKRLLIRWQGFGMWAFVLTLFAAGAASDYPVLKPVLRLVVPLFFFTWAPAELCAMVLWGSRYQDWKSYLCNVWRPMLVATMLGLVYWRARGVAEGLPLIVKWAQLVVGMALSPVFLRLSGFFELDEFRLEPAPKSVILGPTGREL